jgi:hypothetical protein
VPDTTGSPDAPHDAHEALIRRQAAAKMLAYGDRARALGIDIDDVAAGLMAAADEWEPNDAPPVYTEADLDLAGLAYWLARDGYPEQLLDRICYHFGPIFSEHEYECEPLRLTMPDAWDLGRSHAADVRREEGP